MTEDKSYKLRDMNYGWPKAEGDTAFHPLDGKYWLSAPPGSDWRDPTDIILDSPNSLEDELAVKRARNSRLLDPAFRMTD